MAVVKLTDEEAETLAPFIERCDSYLAGVRAALDFMKQEAVETILAARKTDADK